MPAHQWQAHEPPQAAGGDVLLPAAEPALAVSPAGAAAPLSDGTAAAAAPALAARPLRKSVAYQPEPLSWKPGALSCFEKDSAPQAGQVLSTGSEIFCSTSLACPHALQR